MKLRFLYLIGGITILFLSSCLKEYTCDCETTTYQNDLPIGTKKETSSFNATAKARIEGDCRRLQDSVIDQTGSGHITRCELK